MAAAAVRQGALVTGGSSGIGATLVAQLLQGPPRVERVFVTGQRAFEETPLAAWLKENLAAEEAEARVRYSSGDTGDEGVVAQQVAEAMEFFDGEPPSGIFLNAGIGGGRSPLEEFAVERFDALMHTNVRGVFLWLRSLLPHLKATSRPSQVVVTSSVGGLRGIAQSGPYCATKFAVQGLVLSLRAELKAQHPHIKVGLVCPGAVATPWWDDPSRGYRAAGQPKPDSLLAPEAVAAACIGLMEQHESANAEMVVIDPA